MGEGYVCDLCDRLYKGNPEAALQVDGHDEKAMKFLATIIILWCCTSKSCEPK